ncbi:MAG: hypothetical protein LBG89_04010 [Rickettsiales bacterium]|jgi:hypothetical protein|nr:hypothetical protein [Rickettsiales bacterium]
MKAQIVYISCGEGHEPADIQKALDDVRAQLDLPKDAILFGIPVDQQELAPISAKPILGKLNKLNNVMPRPLRVIPAESNDLEDILGDISPLAQDAPPAPSDDFPQSVHDLAEEMGALNENDFDKINEGILSKTAKGVSELLNVIPFKTRKKKAKNEPGGPNLFDWGGGAANASEDRFDFPDALKGLI